MVRKREVGLFGVFGIPRGEILKVKGSLQNELQELDRNCYPHTETMDAFVYFHRTLKLT